MTIQHSDLPECIKILKSVRRRIRRREGTYICNALSDVRGRYILRMYLKSWVHTMLGRRSTLEEWYFNIFPDRSLCSVDFVDVRVRWLTWMIGELERELSQNLVGVGVPMK